MLATDKVKLDNTITASNSIKAGVLQAPTSSGGSTYGAGTSGQVLKTNGTNIYWGADNNTTYTAGAGLTLSSGAFKTTYTYVGASTVTTS